MQGLVRLAVFVPERRFLGTIAKIPGSTGKIGNFARGIVGAGVLPSGLTFAPSVRPRNRSDRDAAMRWQSGGKAC
jgi:hypothetical protein